MKSDRVIIFSLVGVMLFSAVATGLLFLAQTDDQTPPNNSPAADSGEQRICEASAEVANQPPDPEGEWPTTVETPIDSLQILDLRNGSGRAAAVGNCITVNYRLSLADGTPVDGNDTFESGDGPIAFELLEGSLIAGWVEGIPGLKEGGLRRLLVPASLAYGPNERPGIPADSDLIFDVELVKVEY